MLHCALNVTYVSYIWINGRESIFTICKLRMKWESLLQPSCPCTHQSLWPHLTTRFSLLLDFPLWLEAHYPSESLCSDNRSPSHGFQRDQLARSSRSLCRSRQWLTGHLGDWPLSWDHFPKPDIDCADDIHAPHAHKYKCRNVLETYSRT